jgi:gentisate 1,2-dioxygenase
MVIEGSGGFTVVQGEKCQMEKGDLILTPSGLWHEHGHEGTGPVIWLDALDLPIVHALEASYAVEGKPQTVRNEPDSSQSRYRQSGLVPYRSLDARRTRYPLLRYPWKEVREALAALAEVTPRGELVQLAYVNPETGRECMPVLGFSAIMLQPGETIAVPRRSASAVLHVVEGEGEAEVDGVTLSFGDSDVLAIPTHAKVLLANRKTKSPAYLFQIDDAPLQRKCGFYEVFK